MGSENWYRNTEWNAEIEEKFFQKLGRARQKSQYLRVQAYYLAEQYPLAALSLLEKYFALGVNSDLASAYVDEAKAYISLGKIEEAIISLRKALEREHEFPNLKTTAWREFALLVGMRGLKSHFADALRILEENRARLTFPVDAFIWHAARALILHAQADRQAARVEAAEALNASELEHSGFRYHAKVGLVGSEYKTLKDRLSRL